MPRVANPGPSYLRLGKAGEPKFHAEVPVVEPGRWLQVEAGDEDGGETLLATGAALGIALARSRKAQAGRRPAVHSLPLWGMGAKGAQAAQVARHARVTTFEDHLRDAGFGSWLVESLGDSPELLPLLRAEALDARVCGTVGSQLMLNALGGLLA